jgi:hypothetical protein
VVVMRAYRVRVYGKPRKNIDAHQFVQAVLMLARELHNQHLQEQARGHGSEPETKTAAGDE